MSNNENLSERLLLLKKRLRDDEVKGIGDNRYRSLVDIIRKANKLKMEKQSHYETNGTKSKKIGNFLNKDEG